MPQVVLPGEVRFPFVLIGFVSCYRGSNLFLFCILIIREAKVGFLEKYPALVTGFFFFMWYALHYLLLLLLLYSYLF